jgi:hypothetical protein
MNYKELLNGVRFSTLFGALERGTQRFAILKPQDGNSCHLGFTEVRL